MNYVIMAASDDTQTCGEGGAHGGAVPLNSVECEAASEIFDDGAVDVDGLAIDISSNFQAFTNKWNPSGCIFVKNGGDNNGKIKFNSHASTEWSARARARAAPEPTDQPPPNFFFGAHRR